MKWQGVIFNLFFLLSLSCVHYNKISISELAQAPELNLGQPIATEAEVLVLSAAIHSRGQKLEYNPYPLFLPDQPWLKGYRLTGEVRTRRIIYRVSGFDNILVREQTSTEPFPNPHKGRVRVEGRLEREADSYILNAASIEPVD
jgi:hypothetical protein